MRLLFSLLILSACGMKEPAEKFVSTIDGDKPITYVATEKLLKASEKLGTQVGARRRLLEASLPILNNSWYPEAKGEPQVITIELDENTQLLDENGLGPCQKNNYMMWTIPGYPTIYICPNTDTRYGWIFCVDERPSQRNNLYGVKGCVQHIKHETGHILGAQFHLQQNGRPEHLKGPILCGWSSDCVDPNLPDYTQEDIDLICNDGGWNGRCPKKTIPSTPMNRHVIGEL